MINIIIYSCKYIFHESHPYHTVYLSAMFLWLTLKIEINASSVLELKLRHVGLSIYLLSTNNKNINNNFKLISRSLVNV